MPIGADPIANEDFVYLAKLNRERIAQGICVAARVRAKSNPNFLQELVALLYNPPLDSLHPDNKTPVLVFFRQTLFPMVANHVSLYGGNTQEQERINLFCTIAQYLQEG